MLDKIDKFEQNAEDARYYAEQLKDICEAAKTFNIRESLSGDGEETSYDIVFQLQKDFKLYVDLWTTIDLYRTSEQRWRYNAFNKLDPEELEETVDNSNRILGRVVGLCR